MCEQEYRRWTRNRLTVLWVRLLLLWPLDVLRSSYPFEHHLRAVSILQARTLIFCFSGRKIDLCVLFYEKHTGYERGSFSTVFWKKTRGRRLKSTKAIRGFNKRETQITAWHNMALHVVRPLHYHHIIHVVRPPHCHCMPLHVHCMKPCFHRKHGVAAPNGREVRILRNTGSRFKKRDGREERGLTSEFLRTA